MERATTMDMDIAIVIVIIIVKKTMSVKRMERKMKIIRVTPFAFLFLRYFHSFALIKKKRSGEREIFFSSSFVVKLGMRNKKFSPPFDAFILCSLVQEKS
jgi:hypothetical protein